MEEKEVAPTDRKPLLHKFVNEWIEQPAVADTEAFVVVAVAAAVFS